MTKDSRTVMSSRPVPGGRSGDSVDPAWSAWEKPAELRDPEGSGGPPRERRPAGSRPPWAAPVSEAGDWWLSDVTPRERRSGGLARRLLGRGGRRPAPAQAAAAAAAAGPGPAAADARTAGPAKAESAPATPKTGSAKPAAAQPLPVRRPRDACAAPAAAAPAVPAARSAAPAKADPAAPGEALPATAPQAPPAAETSPAPDNRPAAPPAAPAKAPADAPPPVAKTPAAEAAPAAPAKSPPAAPADAPSSAAKTPAAEAAPAAPAKSPPAAPADAPSSAAKTPAAKAAPAAPAKSPPAAPADAPSSAAKTPAAKAAPAAPAKTPPAAPAKAPPAAPADAQPAGAQPADAADSRPAPADAKAATSAAVRSLVPAETSAAAAASPAARPAEAGTRSGADAVPSWPRVLATTIALWAGRRLRALRPAPSSPAGAARDRRRGLSVLVIAVICVAVAAAVVVMFIGVLKPPKIIRAAPARHPVSGGLASVEHARQQAAYFVATQVSRSAIVGCDPAMCLALQASGFPRSNLVPITQESNDTLQESVVVATEAVRSQFGSKLAAVYAPLRLARYGSGTARIDIRAAEPVSGPNAKTAMQAALAQRKSNDGSMAQNPDLTASSAVRAQLAAGQADERLAAILVQPLDNNMKVHILALGDAGPGADPVVYRALYLGAAGPDSRSYFSQLEGWIKSAQPQYTSTYRMLRKNGQPELYVQVAAPSP